MESWAGKQGLQRFTGKNRLVGDGDIATKKCILLSHFQSPEQFPEAFLYFTTSKRKLVLLFFNSYSKSCRQVLS